MRDDAEFRRLYQAHRVDVQKYVAMLIRRAARREEVCQDTWEAVRKSQADFRGDASRKTWILSIARHKAIDSLRRSLDPAPFQAEAHESLLTGLGLQRPRTPSSMLLAKQRGEALQRVLATLDAEERELLQLRFVMELKPAEIVKVLELEVPPNTLSQRLVRLVRRVLELLEKEDVFRSL